MSAAQLVAAQRQWIVDTVRGLDEDGWEASTLCEGWTVEDLVAHLVARERNLLTGPGILFPALSGLHERGMEKEIARGQATMLERLEEGPHLKALWDQVNVVEFWVHAEDLARGSLAIDRQGPNQELSDQLWKTAKSTGRMNLRRVKAQGTLRITDTDSNRSFGLTFGSKLPSRDDEAAPDVTMSGPAGEIVLFLYGRRGAAEVEFSPADNPLAQELSTVRLGI